MDREYLYNKTRTKTVVTVDIDGTITVETEGWDYENRTPRLSVIKKVNELYEDGKHHIILWTARMDIDYFVTIFWLQRHGVKYHELLFNKPFWDLYICDKSINVEDWLNGNDVSKKETITNRR